MMIAPPFLEEKTQMATSILPADLEIAPDCWKWFPERLPSPGIHPNVNPRRVGYPIGLDQAIVAYPPYTPPSSPPSLKELGYFEYHAVKAGYCQPGEFFCPDKIETALGFPDGNWCHYRWIQVASREHVVPGTEYFLCTYVCIERILKLAKTNEVEAARLLKRFWHSSSGDRALYSEQFSAVMDEAMYTWCCQHVNVEMDAALIGNVFRRLILERSMFHAFQQLQMPFYISQYTPTHFDYVEKLMNGSFTGEEDLQPLTEDEMDGRIVFDADREDLEEYRHELAAMENNRENIIAFAAEAGARWREYGMTTLALECDDMVENIDNMIISNRNRINHLVQRIELDRRQIDVQIRLSRMISFLMMVVRFAQPEQLRRVAKRIIEMGFDLASQNLGIYLSMTGAVQIPQIVQEAFRGHRIDNIAVLIEMGIIAPLSAESMTCAMIWSGDNTPVEKMLENPLQNYTVFSNAFDSCLLYGNYKGLKFLLEHARKTNMTILPSHAISRHPLYDAYAIRARQRHEEEQLDKRNRIMEKYARYIAFQVESQHQSVLYNPETIRNTIVGYLMNNSSPADTWLEANP